jgi:hypothetical protein
MIEISVNFSCSYLMSVIRLPQACENIVCLLFACLLAVAVSCL